LSIPQSKLKHAVISTKDIKVNKAIIMNFVYQKFIDCGNVYRKETKKKRKKNTHITFHYGKWQSPNICSENIEKYKTLKVSKKIRITIEM
jgi:hypothetical protein